MTQRTDRVQHLEPTFVEFIPELLESGHLYVSMEYGAVAHLCACGCGSKVDTPLTPTDWTIRYDGQAVTLNPSVGSWSLPCRSHYIIAANCIRWAGSWSDERIHSGRVSDQEAKQLYYEDVNDQETHPEVVLPRSKSMWSSKIWVWFRKWWPW